MNLKEIKNRTIFRFPSMEKLRAKANFDLYVPAGILDPPGLPISKLIVLSDPDAELGLKESTGLPGKVSSIVVKMKIGDEVHLGRSAEVMIDGLDPDAVAFEIIGTER